MPKKKKKREKGGDGMTLAQRIEAMKKEKEEASLRQATTVEEEPAAEEPTKTEEPSVEIVEDEKQQSQEEPETEKPEDLGEIPDTNLRQNLIPPEFENRTDSFFLQPKDRLSQMNFEFGYLPPAMFLPEQSYVSRRAYQMFGKYHDYIDNIEKLLDHTLRTIIINNSNSPEDRTHTADQDMPQNEDQVRALIRYLLTDNMQMEMDRFLADV